MKRNKINIKMKIRNSCPICRNKKIVTTFKYKNTPLEDNFVTKKEKKFKQKIFPLVQMLCKKCGHVFLKHIVNQKENYLYYLYNTEVTLGLQKHFQNYAKSIIQKYKIENNSFCFDIGSNDVSMLKSLKKNKMRVLGIEPCYDIAKRANASGLKTINSFFDKKVVKKILDKNERPKLITLNYIFANIDNILSFCKNLKSLLADDGIIVIETGYHPEQMKNKMFDYVYHEHFSYFSLQNIKFIFNKIGLEVLSASITRPKGGSIRIVIQHNGANRKKSKSINKIILSEKKQGIKKLKIYKSFFNTIEKHKKLLLQKLINFKKLGKKIVALGASHSTTVLTYHFGLKNFIDYIVDDNKRKHNLFSPGYHIPVFSTEKIYKDSVDIIIVLAWQHQKKIIEKHKKFIKSKGFFLIPLPKIKIVR